MDEKMLEVVDVRWQWQYSVESGRNGSFLVVAVGSVLDYTRSGHRMDDDKVPRNLYPDPVLIPSIYTFHSIPEQWSDRCDRRGLTCLRRNVLCERGRPKKSRVSWRWLGNRIEPRRLKIPPTQCSEIR